MPLTKIFGDILIKSSDVSFLIMTIQLKHWYILYHWLLEIWCLLVLVLLKIVILPSFFSFASSIGTNDIPFKWNFCSQQWQAGPHSSFWLFMVYFSKLKNRLCCTTNKLLQIWLIKEFEIERLSWWAKYNKEEGKKARVVKIRHKNKSTLQRKGQWMEHPLETEKSKQWIIKELLSGLYSNGPVFDFGQ